MWGVATVQGVHTCYQGNVFWKGIQNLSLNIILPNVKYLSNYVQRERNSVVLFYGNLTLQFRPIFKQQKSYYLNRLMDWWTITLTQYGTYVSMSHIFIYFYILRIYYMIAFWICLKIFFKNEDCTMKCC
jgi:hypothetical protein